jgi:glycosyltransferase involved in cell wall biosynthesis
MIKHTPSPMKKKDRYLVSVVITTKNRSAMLRQAIESVLAVKNQNHPKFDIELIVVDDGSTDDTPEVVKGYPLRSFRTTGLGMAGARNLGLREATGDFFTLLDDDDAWLPENITPHIELFDQRPELGAVHAQYRNTRIDLTPFGEPGPECSYESGWLFEELLTYFPQVATILTRMDVAREAGDFDPSLTGDNDWDWLLRVARRYPIGRVAVPVLLFRNREKADERLAWRRFPALIKIFNRHTRDLGLLKRLRLRPILWSHRGWWATAYFLTYARMNFENGERGRALRSFYYAFRASFVHTLLHLPKFLTAPSSS